ncbi:hypothetical protein GOV04_04405, partial [Candidatus Woesearchaeota archaeon]|nr:hypothetical protein [Candidatus Woesearchaeota archaeon]
MFNNKKAVSGLIVAVLLVAISLTIGGLIMGWVNQFSEENLETATQESRSFQSCTALSFAIERINVTDPDGSTDGEIRLKIRNKAEGVIEDWIVDIETNDSTYESFSIETANAEQSRGITNYVFNTSTTSRPAGGGHSALNSSNNYNIV